MLDSVELELNRSEERHRIVLVIFGSMARSVREGIATEIFDTLWLIDFPKSVECSTQGTIDSIAAPNPSSSPSSSIASGDRFWLRA